MDQLSRERTVPIRDDRADPAGMSTAKALFFAAAGISLVASVAFYFTGDTTRGIFVGIWVPSILSAGSLLMQGHSHD